MSSEATPVATYDLHLHTYWSYDATANPEGYFKHARELGLRCIAITEHHVLDSLEDVSIAGIDYPDVRIIPSAEFSVTTSIGSVDLLCYGLPGSNSDQLNPLLDVYHSWQREAGEAISKGVQALGHDFSDTDRLALLQSYRPAKAIEQQGTTHVKGAILRDYFVQRGIIARVEDHADFMTRVRAETPSPPYPDVGRVVPAVKSVGGLVAIAHPFGYFKQCDLRRMDALREECGLDGIECGHPGIPSDFSSRYRAYCERNDLFSVAGSDCHSDDDANNKFARHGGDEAWLDEFLDILDNRAIV